MMENSRASLVIRNGLVMDGLGGVPVVADVVVDDGFITAVTPGADIAGDEEIDAGGCIVTPGFIDLHTHYDGQAIWSDSLIPSTLHGVTTVVMGNCGVGFAPCRPGDRERLIALMEGVEDIPEPVMATGLAWDWETFPDFLVALERRRREIDVLAYVPHSPVRVYAMGTRGVNREPADEADLRAMASMVTQALEQGAIGFSSSNVPVHRTRDGEHIPSFGAAEREFIAIAEAAGRVGRGILQLMVDLTDDVEDIIAFLARVSRISGLTTTFTLTQRTSHPRSYRKVLDLLDRANMEPGVSLKAQVFPRPIGMILSHNLTLNPFSLCPSYRLLDALPFERKIARLRDGEVRATLLNEKPADPQQPLFQMCRAFGHMFELGEEPDYEPPGDQSIAARAGRLGIRPEELSYDLLLKNDGRTMLLSAISNYPDGNLDATFDMLRHPHCLPGLGDGGAHYGMICDSSYPTYMLTHWVRDRNGPRLSLPEAIEMMTSRPARMIGLADRGVVAAGYKADINVIDAQNLRLHLPEVVHDLPGGGRRLLQRATGYRCIVSHGEIILRDDEPTGAKPGRLVRETPKRRPLESDR